MFGGRAQRALGIAKHGREFGRGDRAHVGADLALERAVGCNALEDDAAVIVSGMKRERNGKTECTPMPETATWWRSVVCLAPFIDQLPPAHRSAARPHPQAPRGHIFAFSRSRPLSRGGHPQGTEKSLSLLKLRLKRQAFSNSRFLTDCYSFLPQLPTSPRPCQILDRLRRTALDDAGRPRTIAPISSRKFSCLFKPLSDHRTSKRPRSGAGSGAVSFDRSVSWPGGGGRPGYRADRPPPNYAQARTGHGDRGLGRGPAGIFRHRVRRPALRLTRGRALRRALELRHRPCGRGGRAGGASPRRPAAKTDRGEPLHQRHALLLGMIVVEFAPLGPNLVLRRQRQLIDPRHARRARASVRAPAE